MKWVNSFFYGAYLDIVAFFREKIAVFFSLLFPILLFIVFTNIWGQNDEYIIFLLTGIICMMSISEGLFSVGPVVKDYFSSGMIKYLKFLPVDGSFPFLTFVCGRLIFFQLTVLLLALLCYFIYEINVFIFYQNIVVGSVLGFVIFSFIGLSIAFFHKKSSGLAFTNLLYFLLIFTNDLFYPISNNILLKKFNYYLPVDHVANILRGQTSNFVILLVWLVLMFIFFRYLFYKVRYSR